MQDCFFLTLVSPLDPLPSFTASYPVKNRFINGDNRHSVGMFPIRDNRVRMMLDDGMLTQEQFDARESKTVDKEYFEKLLQETMGTLKLKILSYNWLTYYRVNERRAADFTHKGRIFLAGDAAHCHSPAGGQGTLQR